jgi:hypothetical protein
MLNRITKCSFAVAALALGSCTAPPPAMPRAVSPTPATMQGGEIAALKPTEEQIAYGRMASVAMKQSRLLTLDKSVALFQGDDPRHPMYPIIKAVLDDNRYREVHRGEMQLACTVPDRAGLRTANRNAGRTCGLDRADILLQIITTQIMRDSGYVGGYMTQVLPGDERPKTTVFCFIAVWRQRAWEDVHNSLVGQPGDCSAGKKH